ncbi:50S ribosomal protein L22P [Aeropyrum pernix K1]|uniref:Large ribosomal subunit protein uL22 n=1 Tax=Aeropyrum pernix (strain ATCC 700893 / DSM 11879 / JCM 9820 / NBRC 100138 / K1) TaxID=272557 RepID=RL22_AERPE|nr:50S ribosomal protein L22 [Aeropyrum pernix]Q9YF76.1 RecName: Full=Large ribosomal subunit protein uL22; AltName: Full=50S ribosomal protein L22 [Aeropyrum pernix K1]BAA79320.1 50S ribosomal protein L22P [Aeropyrum pernix K1]
MPRWGYSVKLRDESEVAKAVLRNVPVHPKIMAEVARAISGMRVDEARRYLRAVIEKREAVPFRRAHGKQAHRRGLADKWGWPVGRYPVKAARYMLKLLDNVEANAANKNLDVERLKIIHVAAHKGITLKRWMPRAWGRATPRNRVHSHIEIMVREV